jgi:hypothetical protein
MGDSTLLPDGRFVAVTAFTRQTVLAPSVDATGDSSRRRRWLAGHISRQCHDIEYVIHNGAPFDPAF